jgi:hypothetical protein
MQILEIRSMREMRLTESLGEKGKIQVTASEELLVVTDTAFPDFASAAENQSPYAPYNAPIPRIGLQLLYGGYLLTCSNRQWSHVEDAERCLKVVIEYTALSDEQAEPEKPQEGDSETWQNMSLESYAIEKPAIGWLDKDKVGTETDETGYLLRLPAYNTAGDPIDGLTMQTAGIRMTYANTKAADPDFVKLFEYVNTVNRGKWLGADEYTVRVAGYRADYDQKNQTWSVSVEFVYDPSGQQIRFLNAGFNEKIDNQRRAIVDLTAGNPVSKPVPLGLDGRVINLLTGVGTNPFDGGLVERQLHPYEMKNFDNLFADCRI